MGLAGVYTGKKCGVCLLYFKAKIVRNLVCLCSTLNVHAGL